MALTILDGDGNTVPVATAPYDGAAIDQLGVRRRVRAGEALLPGWELLPQAGAGDDGDGEGTSRRGRGRGRGKARTAPSEDK